MGKAPYLLDSHTLLWALFEPNKLSPNARSIIRSRDSVLCVSAATAVELSHKHRLGKLPGIEALFVGYRRHVLELVSEEVPVTGVHALEAGQLEWDHRDPFDRLIAAQAIVEGFSVITADKALQEFALVETVW
ncbi:PilT protein domain-containing protein [Arthrobacter crystallopoietes BAB-32]|uniref:PilT protein domain-containing protein n=1 Tax=Arthrobacter crystallopoietes BAB-32 TaxID=1246476 RepID=N1UX46_9MICC|nr:type II toxin-antitoxin system VapC family toxin [Arthrobacter crystallopoietes]EMY33635.1 PilT protein domain-containing protein [Arthrobacter crystallopoietes BAB-32]